MAMTRNFFTQTFVSVVLAAALSLPAYAAPFDDASAVYAKTLTFGRTLVSGTSAPKNAKELARLLRASLEGSGISHEGLARVVAQTMYELGTDFKLGFTVTPREAVQATLDVYCNELADLKGGIDIPIFTNTADRTTYGKGGIGSGAKIVRFSIADIGTGDLVVVDVEEPVSAG